MYNRKQDAVRPYLTTRSVHPENQETPIQFIKNNTIEQRLFYRRNHFPFPSLSYLNYWLPVNGLVKSPTLFTLADIVKIPSKTVKTVLECAGNKRNLFIPPVFGEQWEKGAMSQANWKGVPLRDILQRVGIGDGAKELIVGGYDYGKRTDTDEIYSYARSLPIEKALEHDTIIAYELNDQPIPFKHGYPFRLIVPKWYAMASVKWIHHITVTDSHFRGPFQSVDYVYYPNKYNNQNAFPVTTMNVNSTIQTPLNMDILNTGKHEIKGIAWTGNGVITKVELSFDGGHQWINANLQSTDSSDTSWITWSYEWSILEKGEYTILSKATDSFGRTQPKTPFWNRKGYGYNAIDEVQVKVE